MVQRLENPPPVLSDSERFGKRWNRDNRLRPSTTGLVAVRKIYTDRGDRFLRLAVRVLPLGIDYDDPEQVAAAAWWKNAWPDVPHQMLEAAMRSARRRRV